MSSSIPVTLQEIAARNRERMEMLGVSPRPRVAEVALLQLVAHVGELATVVHRPHPLTAFERGEVSNILGSVVVSVAMMGDVFGVDIAEAAVQCIGQHVSRKDLATRRVCTPQLSPLPPPVTPGTTAVTTDPGAGLFSPSVVPMPHGDAPVDPLLLSPTTRRSFFPTLDVVAKFDKNAFERLNLTWTAPAVDGKIVEIVPDGQNIRLTFDDLPTYLRLVEPLRRAHNVLQDAPPALQALPSSVAAANATSGVTMRHVDVPVPPGYNANEVKSLFSPTHFDHGLFSPHSVAVGFDVPYPSDASSSPLGAAQDAPAETQKEFFTVIDDIAKGKITGDDIANLHLTFSMPIDHEKVIELIPNGAQVPVAAANAAEFVKLAYESLRNHHQGKVRRTESIKRLQVSSTGHMESDVNKFSPTHFVHNIFAPHSDRTKFYVDYDPSREEDCLPEALRAPRPSTTADYQEYLTTRGVEGFRGVIHQLERKPSDVKRIGVSWCVPSSLIGQSFGEEADALHDLLPNGRHIAVEEQFVTVFLGMAHKYM